LKGVFCHRGGRAVEPTEIELDVCQNGSAWMAPQVVVFILVGENEAVF
jgi:hypothetical protein